MAVPFGPLNGGMADDFRNALIWHMDRHGTKISDLTARTGVSRDVINKLKARPNSSTTVENGMLIASYYGKTLNDFINCSEPSDTGSLTALFSMLRPEERRLLESQIRGLLSERDS